MYNRPFATVGVERLGSPNAVFPYNLNLGDAARTVTLPSSLMP